MPGVNPTCDYNPYSINVKKIIVVIGTINSRISRYEKRSKHRHFLVLRECEEIEIK